MQCRFIDTGFNDAYANMAVDEAILSCCKVPALRVYGWEPAAISIGYNQDISKEINLESCKNNKIKIVRRITGGKAVFHDKEITYSFILPENSNLLPFEINESYRVIANALVIALGKFGIKAEIKKAPERLATPICFNSSNWYELLVNGRKISGSAQRRFSGKILQHGSILTGFDYSKNSSLFNKTNVFDDIENLRKRITSLKSELSNSGHKKNYKKISYKELAGAIKCGFKENFNFNVINDFLTSREKKLADKLREEKYSKDEWNYKH
ncbi:lipoate--protein ligase family protein [Candidatus Woesearchaeota archaeon]|nr:lipoate--protein ligase family protein [Candidatus Woesearchaeota archaeon]